MPFEQRLPAVVRRAVIAQFATGLGDAEALGERKELDTMAVQEVIIGYGGPPLEVSSTPKDGPPLCFWGSGFPRPRLYNLRAVQTSSQRVNDGMAILKASPNAPWRRSPA